MKIAILGTGVYSMAIALQLSKKNNEIFMWSENIERVREFRENHCIAGILDGFKIPNNIIISNDYKEVIKDAKVIFIATVAKYVSSVCNEIKELVDKNMDFCIASKGIELDKCCFLSDIVSNILNTDRVSVISGPTFALDMASDCPSALTIASKNNDTINNVKNVLANESLKLRASDDLIGVQFCGSIKNVIAIASGILDGLGYLDSARAFLITESLHDIKSLIKDLKGNEKTILSYAGVGDLILTATSKKSRNYSFGCFIGSKVSLVEIEKYAKENTVEGYYTLLSIYKLINERNISVPIINLIYDIVINGKNPNILVDFLIKKR